MLMEALKFIFDQADTNAKRPPLQRFIGPRTRVITIDGTETEEVIDKPLITRKAETLAGAAELTEAFQGIDSTTTAYVSEKGIVVVLDDDDRLESVCMDFEVSDQYAALVALDNGRSQRELVKILRTTLAGCVENDAFLSIVRQLEFDVARASRGDVQHTKESLGKSVEKEVRANAGDLPEEIRVAVPLFTVPHDVPTELQLNCAVTLDIDNEKLAISPTGDSLARERKRVMTEIVSRFDALMPEGSLVVFGECAVKSLVS